MSGIRAFRIASIPVHVTVWFALVLALFAMHEDTLLGGLIVVLAVALSILVHELGHGLVARRYRLHPSITLHGFGGLCSHRPARSWRHDLLIILAGPGAGFLLGGAMLALKLLLDGVVPAWYVEYPAVYQLVTVLMWFNLFWSAVNLAPMWPLDGGQAFRLIARRKMPPADAHRLTHYLGIGLGALGVLLALGYRWYFAAVIAGFIVYDNIQALSPPRGVVPLHDGGGHVQVVYTSSPRAQSWRPTPMVKWLLLGVVAVWLVWVVLLEAQPASTIRPAFNALRLEGASLSGVELWRLATYMWLHDTQTIGHVLMNGIGLWVFGSVLERRWGGKTLLRFYLLTGVGAGLFSALLALVLPGTFGDPIVGASGAVFGLLAAFSFVMPNERLFAMLPKFKAKYLVWVVLGLDTLLFLSQTTPDRAWQTHLGGVLTAWLLVTGNWRPSVLVDRWRLWRLRSPRGKPELRVIKGGKDDDDRPRYLH